MRRSGAIVGPRVLRRVAQTVTRASAEYVAADFRATHEDRRDPQRRGRRSASEPVAWATASVTEREYILVWVVGEDGSFGLGYGLGSRYPGWRQALP